MNKTEYKNLTADVSLTFILDCTNWRYLILADVNNFTFNNN